MPTQILTVKIVTLIVLTMAILPEITITIILKHNNNANSSDNISNDITVVFYCQHLVSFMSYNCKTDEHNDYT